MCLLLVLSRPYLACVFSSVVFMGERFILIPESILMYPSVCVCVRARVCLLALCIWVSEVWGWHKETALSEVIFTVIEIADLLKFK